MVKYELKSNNVVVLGAGISGLSAAKYCLKHGARVTLYDANVKAADNDQVKAMVAEYGLELLLGEVCPDLRDWRLAVKSPGIAPTVPFVQSLHNAGIPVISELELAYQGSALPFCAITGTNGKTTTTTLTYEIIKAAGLPVLLGGNIGLPLAETVDGLEQGIIVAEVSSFQLEDSPSFAPHAAAVLNITPDHLNRHGSMENYTAVKRSIIERQLAFDFAILNYEDELTRGFAPYTAGKVLYFSSQQVLDEGAFVEDGCMVIRYQGITHSLLPFSQMQLKGRHNLENALAAALLAFCMGADIESIISVLRAFKGVEHRQELVRELKGVQYVNDSKGTNPDSTVKALEAYEQPIVLIAGGMDKKVSFKAMLAVGRDKIRELVLLGECRRQLEQEAREIGIEHIHICEGFEEAVLLASSLAQAGDIVLLSPACASWDMFKSYEVRGRLFKDIINSLV